MQYGKNAAWLLAAAFSLLPCATISTAAAQNTVSHANVENAAIDEAAMEAALAAGAMPSAKTEIFPKEPSPTVDLAESVLEPVPLEQVMPQTYVENVQLSTNAAARIKDIMQKFRLLGDPNNGAYRWIYTSPTQTAEAISRPAANSSYFLLAGAQNLRFQSLDCDEIWYFHEGCGMKMTLLFVDGTVHTFELGTHGKAMPMILIPRGQIFAAENIDHTDYSFISCMAVPALDAAKIRVFQREELLEWYPKAKETIERYTDAPPSSPMANNLPAG